MAGKGMGAATKGGGCVERGPKNRVIKQTSQTTGPVMMANGGAVLPAQASARATQAREAVKALPAKAKGARPFRKGGMAKKKGCK
jgi:hypothetical protein